MHFYITFCLSVLLSSYQSRLLSLEASIGLLAAGFFLLLLYGFGRHRALLAIFSGMVLGFGYANLIAGYDMGARLPESLEKEDIKLKISIGSLPVDKGQYQQFDARVITAESHPGQSSGLKTLLLNWYGSEPLAPCDVWLLTVRLKRPHGLANPGGFDYEAYLLQRGIQAKGYVRDGKLLEINSGFCLNGLRQQWKDHVEASLPREAAAWVVALSIGDKNLMNTSQRLLLMETGITHLFVISGSHISLCAAVVYFLVMGLRRIGGGLLYSGDWRPLACFLSLLAATAYTAIAGFGIPSQRALVMLTVFMGGQIVGIHTSLWLRYWISMSLVLLINPLSLLDTGFILSFAAVFVLILLVDAMQARKREPDSATRIHEWFRVLVHSQCYVFLGLLPFTLLYFSQVPLVSPVVNMLAIPVVSFLIVPDILLALVAWSISGSDFYLLKLAAIQLDCLFRVIAAMNQLASSNPYMKIVLPGNFPTMAVLFFATFLLLLPQLLLVRGYGLLLMVAIFLARIPAPVGQGGLVVDVIDVEQGLSVLVQTENHRLLYDVGSAWPEGSMADMAVAPYLSHYGITHLDKLVISHLDNDHAGGLQDLLEKTKVTETLSGEPNGDFSSTPCESGIKWRWDGVDFTLLHPDALPFYKKSNNYSCVLLVEAAGKRVLLPGDIESSVEQKLVAAGLPEIDVLLAPHHGSKTSSGMELVGRLGGEKRVIFSSGYLNQFGHPHPDVTQRYEEVQAKITNTALQGAIHIDISPAGNITASSWREKEGRYWHKMNRTENRQHSVSRKTEG